MLPAAQKKLEPEWRQRPERDNASSTAGMA